MSKLSNQEIIDRMLNRCLAGVQPELALTQALLDNSDNPLFDINSVTTHAEALVAEGQFLATVELLVSFFQKHPNSPQVFLNGFSILIDVKNAILERLRKNEEVEYFCKIYEQLNELGLISVDLLLPSAHYFLKLGHADKALLIYRRFKTASPNALGLKALEAALDLSQEYARSLDLTIIEGSGNALEIVQAVYKIQELNGEKKFSTSIETAKTLIESKRFSEAETDYLLEYLAYTYEKSGNSLEALEIYANLVEKYPTHFECYKGKYRNSENVQIEAQILEKIDPNSKALVRYFNVLNEVDYCPNSVKEAVALQFAREHRYEEAKSIILNHLEINPNGPSNLESALKVATEGKDIKWIEEILIHLKQLTAKHSFLLYHRELIRKFSQ